MESRSLSKTEAKVILSLEADGRELISLAEIRERAAVSDGFARKLAHDLVNRGWLQRVRRGVYLLNPSRRGPDALPDLDPLRLGSHLVEPYYFAYATAAELHGFFPQASRQYYIATTARRAPPRGLGTRFRLVRVKPSRFFGATKITRRGEELRVSDPERTVLDSLNRPELSGGVAGVAQILSIAKPHINWGRLASYLVRFGSRSLQLRAGFLAERVRPSIHPPTKWSRAFLPKPEEPFVPLDRASLHGRSGPRDRRWHVIRNISDARLFAEGEVP